MYICHVHIRVTHNIIHPEPLARKSCIGVTLRQNDRKRLFECAPRVLSSSDSAGPEIARACQMFQRMMISGTTSRRFMVTVQWKIVDGTSYSMGRQARPL